MLISAMLSQTLGTYCTTKSEKEKVSDARMSSHVQCVSDAKYVQCWSKGELPAELSEDL
jgi:hypothetical protein